MISISLDKMDQKYLQRLVENKVNENSNMEYKCRLPKDTQNDKKEFLADISSFANGAGGMVFFGIDAKEGIPVSIPGLFDLNVDQAICKYDNMIRDGIEPRILCKIKAIQVNESNSVLVFDVKESYNKPHRVNYGGHNKFYARNSAGKYQLDVPELRSLFLRSNDAIEKIKGFIVKRKISIQTNEIDVQMPDKGRIVLHMIPIDAYITNNAFDIISQKKFLLDQQLLMSYHAQVAIINLDGILITGGNARNNIFDYLQLYRNGTIESVCSYIFEEQFIPSSLVKSCLEEAVEKYITIYEKLDIPFPYIVSICFQNIQNYKFAASQSYSYLTNAYSKNYLDLPIILLEEDHKIRESLKPLFDILWNAFGYPKSD